MKLQVTIDEIKALIKERTGRDVELSVVDNKTLAVTTRLRLGSVLGRAIHKRVAVRLRLDRLMGEELHVTYDGGAGFDTMLSIVLRFYPRLNDGRLLSFLPGQHVIIHLAQVEAAHKALQQVDVKDILFVGDKVVIEFSLVHHPQRLE